MTFEITAGGSVRQGARAQYTNPPAAIRDSLHPCSEFAPPWCNMVNFNGAAMSREASSNKKRIQTTTHMSVGFKTSLHLKLEQIARDKKASQSWILRDVAKKYVANQWPPLPQKD
ncbi:hypothetical protein B5T_01250 [Alloalcanivorax dieselolei B5]|uniref:Ribbon-helix-helix protein CopG domain-containing protein n=1 Tax=Alcanivorax dieselolei (strain DSM 16502 / CGMCC 1.3690 / MCCC 1A00001 / B-5) TaxID=930169 RepID=K0CA75_ALCDB|nr:hypothetical protein B5T_01250 [Alloalcanivorax dieselolei B5]GGK04459.1 hypothetical protein GCM10007426_36670 [Alloalcanivorax dieselolei]